MRTVIMASAMALIVFVSGQAVAGEPQILGKVKTGILPAGGFYSLYEVACVDTSIVTIGGLSRRGGPWCVGEAGELQCFRRSDDATQRACSAGSVAESDVNLDALGQYQ